MAEYPPELVNTIAEALGNHGYNGITRTNAGPIRRMQCSCGRIEEDYEVHLAVAALDAITAGPRAIVDLPEPNSTRYEGDEHEPVDRLGWWMPGSLFGVTQWGYPNQVQLTFSDEPFEPLSVDEARFLAAALLSAAAVAERGETDQ